MGTSALPRWVDFHCHLDLYRDHQALVHECDAEKIATLAVTTTPKAFVRNTEIADGYPNVMVGLGLHPQLVAERSNELSLFEKLLHKTEYVGEVGLDAGPRFYSSFDDQRRIFVRILRACDEHGGKILSLHSVRAVAKVLNDLEVHLPKRTCVPVMHWFTGTKSEAAKAVELGCYFSVNVEMISTEKMHKLLRSIPLDRILTETDGPFVTFLDRPVRPTDIPATVALLAKLRDLDPMALAEQLARNLLSMRSSPAPAEKQL